LKHISLFLAVMRADVMGGCQRMKSFHWQVFSNLS